MPNESILLASTTATEATGYPAGRYLPITHVQQKLHVVPYYWDPIGLAYVVAQQAGSSGGTGLTDAQLRASAVPVSLATNTPDVTDRSARLLGHVTVDSAPSTAVTNAGTFAVQAAATLAAETTKVIGTVNVAAAQTIAVTQATGTNLHVVVDSAPTTAVTLAVNTPDVTDRAGRLVGVVSAANLDVALSTRLKPADTLAGVTTVGAVTAITNALPAGTNTIGGVAGDTANGATDAGNPVKIGGKANSAAPTPVTSGQRVDAWRDLFGRAVVSDLDPEYGLASAITTLRDRQVSQRYTVLADSIADGYAAFWSFNNANGGTGAVSVGEGLLQTSATNGGRAQMVSTAPAYYPGQVAWLNSAIRFGDTGVVGSTLRIGACTVSGTTPQDGFYYELSDTTFNAVTVKAGVATAVASTAWTRVVASPFTLDTNYHQFEIRWTANGVTFLVDNVVRHTASGGATALTGTLNFPMFAQVTNTSAGVNRVLAVRNIGLGRFGTPDAQAVTLATTATVTESTGNLAALVAFNAGMHTDLLTGILRELRITNQLLQSGLNVNDDLDLFRADPSYSLVS